MKKTVAFILIAGMIISFKSEDKKLKVELTKDQWAVILDQMDKSTAPHNEIKITSGWIISQVNGQLADSTKKK